MEFDKNRFLSYGRYDLCINRDFYRNLSLVTLFGTIGIMLLGVLIKSAVVFDSHLSGEDASGNLMQANGIFGMIMMYGVLIFYSIMMCIFAGCWAHNLRKKQGRIIELTLPASNLEKYVWHTGLSIIGGTLVCLSSLFITEIVHFIISAIFFSGWSMDSFIFHGLVTWLQSEMGGHGFEEMVNSFPPELHWQWLISGIVLSVMCSSIAYYCIYIFGNSVLYKWNIIITYIALEAISMVWAFSIMDFTFTFNIEDYLNDLDKMDAFILIDSINWGLHIYSILALLWAALLWWLGYRFFKKAQICNSLNK